MATSRWSAEVVKVFLVMVAAAAVAALMVECNQTLVLAVTGDVTVGEDGVATKKTWAQVREVVADEWKNQHNVQDIKDVISSVAKDAKLKAFQFVNKAFNTEEKTDGATNEATTKVKTKEEYVILESDNSSEAEMKAQVLTSKTQDDEL